MPSFNQNKALDRAFESPIKDNPMFAKMFKDLGNVLNEFCPDNRELCLAHSRLEEALFWATKSIG